MRIMDGADIVLQHYPAAMRKMRVAMVTETYPPEINGVAMTMGHIVGGLQSRGHTVQLIRPRQHADDRPAEQPLFEEVLQRGVPIPRYDALKLGLPAKQALLRLWAKLRPDIVHVVTEGCDHLPLFPRPSGGGGEYLLSVSTLEPRKNMRRLVEAYQLARPHMSHPWPLKIVGPRGWGADLSDLAEVAGVEMLGAVDDTALARLFSEARALAYVPLVEGFGLPPLEAMRAGVPVLSTPIPSVVTGTTVLVDPLDVDAMALGLVRILEHEDTRIQLTAAAIAYTRPLTWAASAAAHVELWAG